MIKSIAKLIYALEAGRRSGPYPGKPWKRKKRKGYKRGWYPDGLASPPRYGGAYPGGHQYRPRGLRGLIVEAILRRVLRHR